MERQKFENTFRRLTEALAVKLTHQQMVYFWEEFQHRHHEDFVNACRELGMGNPGYLPKLSVFREKVSAMEEIRVAREREQRDREAQRTFAGRVSGETPMDQLFAKCASLNIRDIVLSKDEHKRALARESIRAVLEDPEFKAHRFTWRTKEGLTPQDWLKQQIDNSVRPAIRRNYTLKDDKIGAGA
jgi:hypothetical protein